MSEIRRDFGTSGYFVLKNFQQLIQLVSKQVLVFLSLDVVVNSLLELRISLEVDRRPLDRRICVLLLRLVDEGTRKLVNIFKNIHELLVTHLVNIVLVDGDAI